MVPAGGPTRAVRGAVRIRKARPADLPACGALWRRSLNDYLGRLNLPEIPLQLETVGQLHAHTMETDPDRFVVAVGPAGGVVSPGDRAEELVGFASACERPGLWYLSMLFVEPAAQGSGLGRALLSRVLPDPARQRELALGLSSDSAQPVSNGLYASVGIVPRLPVYHLAGRPRRPDLLPPLPSGVIVDEPPPEIGALPDDIHAIDRETLGFDHPTDHAFALRTGRRPFVFRTDGGEALGYGYASPVGHVGPVAVRDPELLVPVLGHLLAAVEPRGASAVWVPGDAGPAFSALVQAGLRLDGFPILLCWTRPFADFGRYLPLSPGLL